MIKEHIYIYRIIYDYMCLQKKLSTVALGITRYSTFKLIATAGFSKTLDVATTGKPPSHDIFQGLSNRTAIIYHISNPPAISIACGSDALPSRQHRKIVEINRNQ